MALQADAIERRARSPESFDQLQEQVAAVAFLAAVVLEAVFIEHQPCARRERTRFHQRAPDVVGPERLEEHVATQPVHTMAGFDRLVDDIPLGDGVAVARDHRGEVPGDQPPVALLAQALLDPGRRAAVPEQRVSAHRLASLQGEPDQTIDIRQRPLAGRRLDGVPFQLDLRRQDGAILQDGGPQRRLRLELLETDGRTEETATTRGNGGEADGLC